MTNWQERQSRLSEYRGKLSEVQDKFALHIRRRHDKDNGVIPTSCHECLNKLATIRCYESVIRALENAIDDMPK